MNDADGAGGGINTRTGGPAFGGGVARCAVWFACAGTEANAVFHAELNVTGTMFGVNCETFPCTLLDEDGLYGDAKRTVAGTVRFAGCGIGADAVTGTEAMANGLETSDAA